MVQKHIKAINECEKSFIKLFTTNYKFSKNLIKYEDQGIFDMYDHNYYEHNKDVTIQEINDAYQNQYNKKLNYLKLISNVRINNKIVSQLHLEKNVVLTMLYDNKNHRFKINNNIVIKKISLKDLNTIELKHYGKLYGADFVRRRNREFFKKCKENDSFIYYGAYLNGKIVGSCHSYTYKHYTCIDSLLVDNRHRHKYIATTLLKYIIDNNEFIYIHADENDSPKNIYKKLGFKTIDKTYEYFKKVNIKK